MEKAKLSEGTVPREIQILDLSKVETRVRNMVPPRITIQATGYVGKGSSLAADEVKKATEALRLSSPLPAALILYPVQDNPSAVRAVPTLQQNPAYLNLDWIEQGRRFRTNMKALLQMNHIHIPRGSRLVMEIRHQPDPELGHCLQISWTKDSYVPVHESPEDDEKEDSGNGI